MNQPIHNDYWLSRFESILNSALVQHRAVSLIRVDLRFPEYMPVTIMDPDPDSAVISRFFASLKAKIQAYQRKKRWANQRVHATSLRYFWCREFGKMYGRKHYHVILLLNKDTWCSLGDFSEPSSLATMIQEAWCSALHLEPWQGGRLPVNRHRLMLALLPMTRLCRVDVLIPGRLQTKSQVKPLCSGSSVVMWKRCRKPGTEPVIS
jgi:hypothetical protein